MHDEDDLDYEGPEPISHQIADRIEEQIRTGELAPLRPVPSQSTIEQRYGVSRDTARRALRRLKNRGMVYGVVGRGTFVTSPENWPQR